MTRKRANGEGTIAKRTDGRFVGAAYVPVIGGGRRRVFVYGRTRREAREKLDELLDGARGNVPRPRTRQTVGGYLDYWLEHVVKPETRGTTFTGYETMVRRHIKARTRAQVPRRARPGGRAPLRRRSAQQAHRRPRWRATGALPADGAVRPRRAPECAVERHA